MNSRTVPVLAATVLIIGGLVASEWALHLRTEAVIGAAIGAALFVGVVVAVLLERQPADTHGATRRRRATRR